MKSASHEHTLVVISGPTVVGKTACAIKLAKSLNTVIISADSRQFYRELSIGTAKPTAEELAQVPHYFVGHLSIHDYYNISQFETDVLELLKQLFVIHPVVIMVGGSGLYIDAICRGIDDFPNPDPELRSYLKGLFIDEGIGKLQELLQQHDPDYFKIVDTANPNRLLRALEVCMTTGIPYSEQRLNLSKKREFEIIKIGLNLPRPELFNHINHRVEVMMFQGLLEEVRSLIPFRHLNALNTVGYKEIFDYLDGNISLEQAVENIKTNTRRYAKRQLTWFKRDGEINWFEPGMKEEMLSLIISGR